VVEINSLAELNSNSPTVDRVDMGPNDRIDSTAVQVVRSYAPDSSTAFVTDEYNGYVEHPTLFLATAWTAGSITTDITSDLFREYVNVAISSGAFVARKLSNFMFVDALLKVTIVVQGSSVAQGKLVFSFDPTPYPDRFAADNTHVYEHRPQKTRAMLIPHIEIDPAESKTYTIELPAPTRYGVYSLAKDDTEDEYSLGSYHMRQTVINTLGSGTTSVPDISIGIYLSLVAPKVSSATQATLFTLTSELLQEKTDPSGGVISGFFKKAADVAGIISVVTPPNISAPLTLFSAASGAVGSFLSWFGFSKPQVLDPTYSTISTQANWTRIDGKLRSDIMALRSNNSVGLNPKDCPLLNYDDMITANLMAKPGLVKQFAVPTATASGALIGSIPVLPVYNRVLDDPAIANAYEMTPLSFATYPYSRWRGNIDIDIEFVCSVFHRCTIIALYDPSGEVPAAPPYLRYVSALQHWTFHVNGHTKHRINIPWKQLAPFKHLGGVQNSNPGLASSTTNGVVWFFLLNPITTNGGTAPVHINLYYSSTEMMLGGVENKFAQPVLILPTEGFARTGSEYTLDGIEEEEEEVPNSALESGAFELTSAISYDSSFFTKFFGEEHTHSVKELAQRQSKVAVFSAPEADPTRLMTFELSPGPLFINPVDNFTTGTVQSFTNLFAFVAYSYVGVRGSVEFTLFPNSGRSAPFSACSAVSQFRGGAAPQVTSNATPNGVMRDFWGGMTIGYTNINPSLQANFPYYYRGLFRPSVSGSAYLDDSASFACVSSNTAANAQPPILTTVWNGAGDDCVFVGYRGTPVMLC
jgi:hypothetical protein